MMHTFKTSSSPEVTALIKKHGTTDGLFIKILSHFANVPVTDINGISIRSTKTGVCYIFQSLKDNVGLTEAEYTVLACWSNELASAKVPFLTAHTHTIIDVCGKGPFSKYDLEFVYFMADPIKSKREMLAESIEKDGDILDLAYEVSKLKEQAPQFDEMGKLRL
ncbi:hypothetical protein ACHAPQ_011205 [Fusarium lateritium]